MSKPCIGTDDIFPTPVTNLIKNEIKFKNGLFYGIGYNFSSINNDVKEKMWDLSIKYNAGTSVMFGLGTGFHSFVAPFQEACWGRVVTSDL